MDWLQAVADTIVGEVIAIVLAAAILGCVGWLTRSIRDLGERLESQAAKADARLDHIDKQIVKIEDLDRHDIIDRVGKLEVEMASVARSSELDRIHTRISERASENAEIRAEVSGVAGEVKAVHQQVNTIVKHLIEQGGK